MYLQKLNNPRNYLFDELNSLFNANIRKDLNYDIVENEDNFEIAADLPGFKKNEIKISTEEDQLIIEAEHSEEKKGKFIIRERSQNSIRQVFNLGRKVNTDNVNASYESGVLKIKLPKNEKSVKKLIEIN